MADGGSGHDDISVTVTPEPAIVEVTAHAPTISIEERKRIDAVVSAAEDAIAEHSGNEELQEQLDHMKAAIECLQAQLRSPTPSRRAIGLALQWVVLPLLAADAAPHLVWLIEHFPH